MPENNQDTKNSNAVSTPEEAPITLDVSQEQQAANEILSGELKHSKRMGLLFSIMFMAIGALFLYAAHQSHWNTHPALSFVYTVLGTATFLFGTGTSGVAFLSKQEASEKFFLKIAGGAGVLSALIFGAFIYFTSGVNSFFAPPVNSYEYRIQLNDEYNRISSKNLPSMALLKINGRSAATHRTDDRIMLIYRTTERFNQNIDKTVKTDEGNGKFVNISGKLYFPAKREKGLVAYDELSIHSQPVKLTEGNTIKVTFKSTHPPESSNPLAFQVDQN